MRIQTIPYPVLRVFVENSAVLRMPFRFGAVSVLFFFICALTGVRAIAAKWEPVNPADLAMKTSASFPGADIEILLCSQMMSEQRDNWIVQQAGDERNSYVHNYVRAKIYTAKGVEDQSKLCIQYPEDCRIRGTEARVIKPDGSITEVKKSDIVEDVLAKTQAGMKWKQVTFVFPGLEAGDLVEYRWTEQIEREIWLKFFFAQAKVPTREYRFSVADMSRAGSVGWFNCPGATVDDKHGFVVTVRNLPAFEAEENMPAELEFRGWIRLAKSWPMHSKDSDVWDTLNDYWGDAFTDLTRPNSAVKKKAEALVAGVKTDQEKLRCLYEFCQAQIFNTTYRVSAELRAAIDKHEDEDAYAPSKVLEDKRGRRDEINFLFASLARGLGFEVKEARTAAMDELLNVRIPQGWAFLGRRKIAVKCGDQWSFFDPGRYFVPYGSVPHLDEGATALICGTKKLEFVGVPGSVAANNQVQRKARMTLDQEGTLEGDVEEVFTGHLATVRKWAAWGDAIDEVNKSFRNEVTKRIPAAEVTDINWTNLDTYLMPLSVKYHVRVPGYAQQAGKRLVFAPSFFEAGAPVVFAATERKFPIYFSYPWSEHDEVDLVLPDGYMLDKPSAPLAVGEPTGSLGVQYKLQYSAKTRTFGYRRDFALGANGATIFKLESYPPLKDLFEKLHKSDTHVIVLKPKPAVPVAAPVEPAPAPVSPN